MSRNCGSRHPDAASRVCGILAGAILLGFLLATIVPVVACSSAFGSGSPRPVRDLIRDTDAAMASAHSYHVEANLGFDVSVLPSAGHVTGQADVVKPDAYLEVKAGDLEERSLLRDGHAYTWDSNSGSWTQSGSVPAVGAFSSTAQMGALLALQSIGNFESLRSDRGATELLRYRLSVDRVSRLTSTILGIVVPDVSGIFDLVGLSGSIDFKFYLDKASHLIDEIVISGDASALNIPVGIDGSIKYSEYDSASVKLPTVVGDPNTQ